MVKYETVNVLNTPPNVQLGTINTCRLSRIDVTQRNKDHRFFDRAGEL
jgi:hypothetical protein